MKEEFDINVKIVDFANKDQEEENNEITVLLKSDDRSPQQIQLNINGFNNEITVLENRTIVSQQT